MEKAYTVRVIQPLIDGTFILKNPPDLPIQRILVDSRQLNFPGETLFFAFKGLRKDGHSYINDLYNKGVRNFVVSQRPDLKKIPKANVLLVSDTILALQKLAIAHRTRYSIPVIGITGSNGKTIVKEWLFQLLKSDYKIVKNPKSYNSQIGVPLSVWLLNASCNLAIFEAGISEVGEMEKIEKIIQPGIGIFTNIGSAHEAGFTSREEKIREKAKLFDACNLVIYCIDHTTIHRHLKKKKGIEKFSWSKQDHPKADLKIRVRNRTTAFTEVDYDSKLGSGQLKIPFGDVASLENALHCLCVCLQLKIPGSLIQQRFQALMTVAMRLELKEGIHDSLLINDVYNADLESLAIALSFANQQSNFKRKSIILTDLLQQAEDKNSLYQKVSQLIQQKHFSRVVGIGKDIPLLKPKLPKEIETHFFPDTASFLDYLPEFEIGKELILVKGARKFTLEQIIDRLSKQKHKTVLEVNLGALARNLKVFEEYIDPTTKIMVMVKADAYGSGSVEIARFLSSRQVDYLAVAYIDEGIQLRKAGISLPILVLNPEDDAIPSLFEYALEPEIYNIAGLEKIHHFAHQAGEVVSVHVKVETGMHRLGFELEELETLSHTLAKMPEIQIGSIFSHLASSDDPLQDTFTQLQIDTFKKAKDILHPVALGAKYHLLNSNGIFRFCEAQFDMVRIGIGMYGIGLPDWVQAEPVHTLKTTISQIKSIQPGETIGYSRAGKAPRKMRIATIGIGYADGLIRKAGNGRYAVNINGAKAPIIGNICMDMTMVDITNIPNVETGDEVIIFGNDPGIDALATAADTIPYEIFTNISSRVKRIYVNE